ncbi:MAG: LD-carboxypeptidase, partial [Eubacterium sp.]|nr:LD-carboxypeptidase [Eubacterium sp.]
MPVKKAGIVACSDPLDRSRQEIVVRLADFLKTMGFEVVTSPAEMMYADPVSGSAKADVLTQMFADPDMVEIFDVSGGDMANELLDFLDFQVIRDSRARLWGYSDLTTLLNAIYARTGKESVLYQACKTVSGDCQALQKERFASWMAGTSDALFAPPVHRISGGMLSGTVVGGNMRCFLKLAGTAYFPDVTGKVLLLESLGGGMPQVITCLSQLKSMGVFQKISGLLLGSFTRLEEESTAHTTDGTFGTEDVCSLVKRFVP